MSIVIYEGQCLEVLKSLPSDSVDCVITSPPYWGLRDYGVDGQIGMEKSIHEHLAVLIEIFDEIRRVLKTEGICWVNYGDCYATTPNGRKAVDIVNDDRGFVDKPFSTIGPIDRSKRNAKRWGGGNNPAQGMVKPKDMCLLPERFIIAMQDAGWWVRAKPIWAKRNPMPESAKDRPTTAYEQLYMFTKSQKYKYDHKAVRIKSSPNTNPGNEKFRNGQYVNNEYQSRAVSGWQSGEGSHDTLKHNKGNRKSATFKRENSKRAVAHPGQTMGTHRPDREDKNYQDGTRSLRQWEFEPPVIPHDIAKLDIWDIPTRSFKEAHFATFPPDLVYRCLQASGMGKGSLVLDPFGGAGTTALVADRLQMDAILIELNPKYVELAQNRILDEQGMFSTIEIKKFVDEK